MNAIDKLDSEKQKLRPLLSDSKKMQANPAFVVNVNHIIIK